MIYYIQRKVLLLLTIISLMPLLTHQCGLTTHSVIAYRAQKYFFNSTYPHYNNIIEKNWNSFMAGAPFPDYLYECGNDHSAGEAAHWPPFQIASVEYIRSLPESGNKDKLIAFMFGCISHSIADVIWHGLKQMPFGYGFIRSLGGLNFDCNGNLCPAAHNTADTGGEFVSSYQTNLDFFQPFSWDIPINDLIKIFAKVNKTVSWISIEECRVAFESAGEAVKTVSDWGFHYETDKAPFMVENFLDLPFGGIDDMAIWSGRMFNRYAEWLENGPPHVIPPDFINPRSPPSQNMLVKSKIVRDLYSLDPAANRINTINIVNDDQDNQVNIINGNSPLEYFGSSLAIGDFDHDGIPDLVIGGYGYNLPGKPQVGKVEIFYQGFPKSGNDCNNYGGEKQIIIGEDVYGRFGYSLAVLDWNQDGIDDLVISAPTSGWNWTSTSIVPEFIYRGKVLIYFGQKGKPLNSEPDFTIISNKDLTFFGSTLATGDINNDGYLDILVGSPFTHMETGTVWGFLSSQEYKSGGSLLMTMSNITISGESRYDWFGYQIQMISHLGILLIGAPGTKESFGKFYAYDLDNDLPELRFTISGNASKGQLGKEFEKIALNANSNYLALSIPSADTTYEGIEIARAGKVIIFPFDDLKGNLTVSDLELYASLEGGVLGGRFGSRILFDDIDNSLIISAPLSGKLLNSREVGSVMIWNKGIPRGLVPRAEQHADRLIPGSGANERFGSSLVQNKKELIIGAPRSSNKNEMSGSINHSEL